MIYSLQLILVLLCIVGAFVYTKADQGVHVRYLISFFVVIAVSEFLQTNSSGLLKESSFLFAVPGTLTLLIPPLVVCYVRTLLGFQNSGYSKWLLIPALLYLTFFSYLYVAGFISGVDFQNTGLYVCASVGGAVYSLLVGLILFHFLSKEYADLLRFVHPVTAGWLKSIVGYLLFMAPVTVSQVGIRYFYGENSTQYAAYHWFYQAVLLLWLSGMIFLMIKSPFVLNTLVPDMQEASRGQTQEKILEMLESTDAAEFKAEAQNHDGQIPSRREMSLEARQDYVAKIRRELEVSEIFLDPKLSLGSLAKRVRISPHQLSYLINSEWKMNFNEFINSYRIAKAQMLLQDINYQTATIFAVGIDSGFNSESSFYTAFKKATGYSPKRYREALKLTSEL